MELIKPCSVVLERLDLSKYDEFLHPRGKGLEKVKKRSSKEVNNKRKVAKLSSGVKKLEKKQRESLRS